MLLFKNIKKRRVVRRNVHSESTARWKAVKEKTANYLQQKSETVSVQTKKYGLLFFCLLFGGTSIAIIIHSVTEKVHFVTVSKISNPSNPAREEKNYIHVDSSITKKEFDKVELFKNYLLRLQSDPFTKKKFDSIIAARPALMDSIQLFEKMYLQQK